MKQYEFAPILNEAEEVVWRVSEKPTEQVIAEFWFEEDAHEYADFLNKGGGFAGFTPSFMLRRVDINMNDAFAMTFS